MIDKAQHYPRQGTLLQTKPSGSRSKIEYHQLKTDHNVGKRISRRKYPQKKSVCNDGNRYLSSSYNDWVRKKWRPHKTWLHWAWTRTQTNLRKSYSSANSAHKKGLCTDLGNNVFDDGHNSAFD